MKMSRMYLFGKGPISYAMSKSSIDKHIMIHIKCKTFLKSNRKHLLIIGYILRKRDICIPRFEQVVLKGLTYD